MRQHDPVAAGQLLRIDARTTPIATYVAALNSSVGQFLQNGTVVGIQLGNEILGQVSAATISTAAQNLRSALNAAGFSNIKIIVSLIEGQAATVLQQ